MDWLRNIEGENKLMKYVGRPPQKRVNYQKFKISYPFGRFDLLNDFYMKDK